MSSLNPSIDHHIHQKVVYLGETIVIIALLLVSLNQGWVTLLVSRATLKTRKEPKASTSTFRLEQVLTGLKKYDFKVIFTIN